MHWIYFLIPLMLFSACASPSLSYKQVLIPTKCGINQQQRPIKSGDLLKDVQAILIYTELLESDLEFCRGVKPLQNQ